jgi:D-amino-acid oxidase
LERAPVESLDELLRENPIVVNCAGLGARELTGDASLVPIRGQVVRVEPGHTRRFIQAGGGADLAYVIPRHDCTVLGGTQDVGAWDLTVVPETAEAIRQRCIALEPDLANAKVLSHAVGLRPGRPEPRLETERCSAGTIVHNYGHGGGGVTLSWGCAEEVVRHVQGAVR